MIVRHWSRRAGYFQDPLTGEHLPERDKEFDGTVGEWYSTVLTVLESMLLPRYCSKIVVGHDTRVLLEHTEAWQSIEFEGDSGLVGTLTLLGVEIPVFYEPYLQNNVVRLIQEGKEDGVLIIEGMVFIIEGMPK